MIRGLLLVVLVFYLSACEAQATPIASISTTTSVASTAVATTASLPRLRYALHPNLAPYAQDYLRDIAYEIVDSNAPLSDYDVVVAYGNYDGWESTQVSQRVSLALNPNLAPLDDPALREALLKMLDIATIVDSFNIPGAGQTSDLPDATAQSIRTDLANKGFPDGFQIVIAVAAVPGLDALVAQWTQYGIDARLVEADLTMLGDTHIVLFSWLNGTERDVWVDQVGTDNVIDLMSLPVSYYAVEGVLVDFDENGFPIPAQN